MRTSQKQISNAAMAVLIRSGRNIDTMTNAYFEEIDRRSEEKYQEAMASVPEPQPSRE